MSSINPSAVDIRKMFSRVAKHYDFLNTLLSLGVHSRWRRIAARSIASFEPSAVLDVATGTADMALEIAASTEETVAIVGIDFCWEMIDRGRMKAACSSSPHRFSFAVAGCEDMPFGDGSFDSVVVAFGIRNVADRNKGLSEIFRVLRRGGNLVILEFSNPRSRFLSEVYRWYFCRILPVVGGIFSDFSAYRYLPASVLGFPSPKEFKAQLKNVGFADVRHEDLTLGITTLYHGRKP